VTAPVPPPRRPRRRLALTFLLSTGLLLSGLSGVGAAAPGRGTGANLGPTHRASASA
jgi:hypothetical protein